MLLVAGAIVGCVLTLLVQALVCSGRASARGGGFEAAVATPHTRRPKPTAQQLEAAISSVAVTPTTMMHGAHPSAHPSAGMVPAPLERSEANGDLSIGGPTESNGWQCLTFVAMPVAALQASAGLYTPPLGVVRFEESGANGRPKSTRELRGVSAARWAALTRCATMGAWQAAVRRLLDDAASEGRMSELV